MAALRLEVVGSHKATHKELTVAVKRGIELKPELATVLSLHHCPCFVPAPSLFRDRDYMLCCRHAASGGRQHHHRHDIIPCKI